MTEWAGWQLGEVPVIPLIIFLIILNPFFFCNWNYDEISAWANTQDIKLQGRKDRIFKKFQEDSKFEHIFAQLLIK